ncbi:MAG: hypothetical protein PHS93_09555 [Candidatus Omnitrophica bacterium]|nr:hypothetical protein [Candidatus Omnitrophota bacterium]MDD5353393.1 hypothetical protein [Candidatus Omnitrophota bacterium]
MDKDRFLELRDVIDSSDPKTTDMRFIVKEVLSDLLTETDSESIEDIFFALNCINLTPSLIYVKISDSFVATNEVQNSVFVGSENPVDIIAVDISEKDQFTSIRQALKSYINEKLSIWDRL